MRLSLTTRNFVISAIFFIASAVIVTQSSGIPPQNARAQSGDYVANWQATHLIVARLMQSDLSNQQNCENPNSVIVPFGDPVSSEVAIGPARWEVKGSVDATTKFKETWSTSTLPNAFTFASGRWERYFNGPWFCNQPGLRLTGNFPAGDWVSGYAHNSDLFAYGYTAVQFRSIPVAQLTTSISNVDPGRVSNIGRGTSCQKTNRCLYTTGPYAWETFHEWDEAGNGKHYNAGMLMPVRWNVTGLICNVGDTRCD